MCARGVSTSPQRSEATFEAQVWFWEGKIPIRVQLKSGAVKTYRVRQRRFTINVPTRVADMLGLAKGDIVEVTIRKPTL